MIAKMPDALLTSEMRRVKADHQQQDARMICLPAMLGISR
jgi:hypothetical protein